jgi:hypothetical protein
MSSAIDAKQSKRRFDQAPRLARVRKKPVPPSLDDDPLLYRDEKAYRAALWDGLAKLARECNAWIITPPGTGRVQIQMAAGSDLLTRLAAFPRYPIMKLGKASRLTHGKFMDVDVAQVELWRGS